MRRLSVQRIFVRLACVLTLALSATLALAQDFSADVVKEKSDNSGLSKIYATKDKIRFEVQSRNAAMGPSALIYDASQMKYTVIMAERHMYMDAPPMMVRPIIEKFWRVDDVNDACPQWKKVAEEAGTYKNWGSCSKVGSETLNGRSAVKYEGVSNKGEKGYIWVDTKLHCVVKTDSQNGGIELRNIQEGSQPSSLFEVPAGYTKFDMGALMQQMPRQPQ
jgi:hypothetical protein